MIDSNRRPDKQQQRECFRAGPRVFPLTTYLTTYLDCAASMASVGGELCGGTVAEEEEIRGLVASICQQSSTPATRQAAEQR